MPYSSAETIIATLRSQYPENAFLALGQTVLWDEPVKAAWLKQMNRHWPEARMIAGIHDTDYFAKTTAHVRDESRYVALPHDDGATRGLWSAAGELSTLFGSEDLPSRAFYEKLGIPFDQLAAADEQGRSAFYAAYTAAWGWRGIVQTTGAPLIAHDVPLSEYWPALESTIDWGIGQSLRCIGSETLPRAKAVADEIKQWLTNYAASAPGSATLSDLYEQSIPLFYKLLLGDTPTNLSTTRSVDLLRFNPTTATLPRFQFVDCFIDPRVRPLAVRAYNAAVAGGGMYPLSAFGEDAVPFDVVVPGRGRGTLHLSQDSLQIDFTPEPASLKLATPITSRDQLASVLASQFGDKVVLVGKAVALVSMLAGEFIVVFHETASGYTDRTLEMNQAIRAAGVDLPLLPIVRIAYSTWDSLSAVPDTQIHLPAHLATAFGQKDGPVTGLEFAARWRDVVTEQKQMLEKLSAARKLRDLIGFFETVDRDQDWFGAGQEIESALYELQWNHQSTAPLRDQILQMKESLKALQHQRNALEQSMGRDFRARLQPLLDQKASDELKTRIASIEEDRRLNFTDPITHLRDSVRSIRREIKSKRAELRLTERNTQALQARTSIAEVIQQAQLTKIKLARTAFLASEGLVHTKARPTSWWLPLLDPSGHWFNAIAETLQARLEVV